MKSGRQGNGLLVRRPFFGGLVRAVRSRFLRGFRLRRSIRRAALFARLFHERRERFGMGGGVNPVAHNAECFVELNVEIGRVFVVLGSVERVGLACAFLLFLLGLRIFLRGIEKHFAAFGVFKAARDSEHCGFAAAARTEKRKHFPAADAEALYRGALAGDGRADTPQTKLMQAVRNYVKRRPEGMSLKSLAEDMGYTQAYLSRRIAQLFGKSFKELVLEERLNEAARLLGDSKLSVEEIIHAVGYENQSYFHREFKKKYGCSPGRYRKSVRSENQI